MRARATIHVFAVCLALCLGPSLWAHEGFDEPEFDSLKACAQQIPNIPANVYVPFKFNQYQIVDVPSISTFEGEGPTRCIDYSWVDFKPGIQVWVRPTWLGVWINHKKTGVQKTDQELLIQDAWDCNHSSIRYGVFVQVVTMIFPRLTTKWQFVGGGLLFGQLVGELGSATCQHPITQFPSIGAESVRANQYWPFAAVRIAVRSWQHNDASLAHTVHVCPNGRKDSSCYWPTRLAIYGL